MCRVIRHQFRSDGCQHGAEQNRRYSPSSGGGKAFAPKPWSGLKARDIVRAAGGQPAKSWPTVWCSVGGHLGELGAKRNMDGLDMHGFFKDRQKMTDQGENQQHPGTHTDQ